MAKVNEGVKRLSLVLGSLGVAIWAAGAIMLLSWSEIKPLDEEQLQLYQQKGHEARTKLDSTIAADTTARGTRHDSTVAPGIGRRRTPHRVNFSNEEKAALIEYLEGKELRQWEDKIKHYEEKAAHRRVMFTVVGLGAIMSFLLPWGTVRTIAWIVEGFRQGRKE